MKKQIVFFDGDGTLWYPKKTKYKKAVWWIYELPGDYKDHCNHLILTPTTYNTLKKLKKMGVVTIILSTHPQTSKVADIIINHKVKHFKISELFDEVHATRGYKEAKGEMILKILKEKKISKKNALMVGDNYYWDYKPARDVGVDALLIKSDHHFKSHPKVNRVKRTISQLKEVIDFIK
jgi:FMN phosphatase YigB (HAD superfamily)